MIKLGITEDYKLLTSSREDFPFDFEKVNHIFPITTPEKLMDDLHATPVDILFASHSLLDCITVPFYGRLKKDFPDIRVIIFNLFNQQKEILGELTSSELKEYERNKKLLISTAKEIFIGPHIVFHENHEPADFLEKYKLFIQGKYLFNDVVYISPREKEIIKLASQEYCGKEIADKLNISIRTVEVHKKNLMERTNSKNFVGVIFYALTNRVITLEELYE